MSKGYRKDGTKLGFQKGNRVNVGRKMSQKTKDKLSLAMKKVRIVYPQNGENNNNWKGGKKVDGDGYVLVLKGDHPYSNRSGYIYEHRLVMERKLGRYLKSKEVIHHIDENKKNNNIKNLMLFATAGEHKKYHYK